MNSDAVSFAQISDLHLSELTGVTPAQLFSKRILGYLSWLRRRRYEHHGEVLDVLKRDLLSKNPDQLLICGDLTHLGLPDEFRQVRDWLDSLDLEAISLVPGNHDSYVKQPWLSTYMQWLPYMSVSGGLSPASLDDVFPSIIVRGNVAFIGLSSAGPSPPFFATGWLGESQIEKLAGLLERTGRDGLFRVVYLHHPPLPDMEKKRKRLKDAAVLTELLKAFGAELVLHGHSHRWQMKKVSSRDVPVFGVASASAQGFHGEIAGYNLFRVVQQEKAWLLEVERRQFDPERQQFFPFENKTLSIGR